MVSKQSEIMSKDFSSNSAEFWKHSPVTSETVHTERSIDFQTRSNEFWNHFKIATNESPLEIKNYSPVSTRLKKLDETEGIANDEYLEDYASKQVLTNFVNNYPSVCHRYGGTLPLTRLNQYEVVNIQASYQWRTKPFCYPRENPSFRKLYPTLPNN